MFRKTSKKRPAQLRRRPAQEEEEDEDDEDDVQTKIQSAQKKLKVMSSLPLVTGDFTIPKGKTSAAAANGTQEGISDYNNTGEQLSALDKKHQQAMQDYIEQELQTDNSTPAASIAQSDPVAQINSNNDQETLYHEIANELYTAEKEEEGKMAADRGGAGAVLVGGNTGIAEVVLPSTSAAKATSFTSSNTNNNNNKSTWKQHPHRVLRMDASSAVPAATTISTKITSSSTPLIRSMVMKPTITTTSSTTTATINNKDNNSSTTATTGDGTGGGDDDNNRLGFAAYRGKVTQDRKFIPKKQRDDNTFRQFVSREREKRNY